MWRIDAVRYYQYLLFFLIIIEVVVIIAVVALMAESSLSPEFSLNIVFPFSLVNFLRFAVLITSLVLLNLFAYTIIYQLISTRTDKRYQLEYHAWMKKWAETYFMKRALETVPLTDAVVEAHLEFTKSLPEKSTMIDLAGEYAIIDFWRKQLQRHNIIKSLRAIEALGILGKAEDFYRVMPYMKHSDMELRIASASSSAYIIQRMPDDLLMIEIERFAETLLKVDLPIFVIEDIYSILDLHNEYLKTFFLAQNALPENLLLATIKVIGTNYNTNFAEMIVVYLDHENPIVQRAVLKVFMQLKYIPRDAFANVLHAIVADDKFVREQALITLKNVPLFQTRLPLWLALGDKNWWVRFAAARMLKDYGKEGQRVLETAAQKHITPQGREIALKVYSSTTP